MIVPRSVRQKEDRTLQIAWADGHESAYPYHFLRDNCPCASCRATEPAGPGPVQQQGCGSGQCGCRSTAAASSGSAGGLHDLKQVTLVGRYALQFGWGDGHTTGIYAFDFLRNLCPCPDCADRPKVLV